MFITIVKRLAFSVLAAIVLTQTSEIRGTDEIPFKSKVAGQQTSRTFLMAPNYILYPQLGFPLNEKFLRVTTSATGNGTLLGNYTIESVYEVEFAIVDGRLTFVSDGTFLSTAANGDTGFGTFKFFRVVGEETFTGPWTLTGGTGRLEGVTGGGITTGVTIANPETGLDSFYYEDEGVQTSVGSRKRKK